jgi:hypothetical protein
MSDFRSGLPIRLFDEDNIAYSSNNPLPVTIEESEGAEIHDYDQAVEVLKSGGTSEHNFTPASEFLLSRVLFAGSGRMKVELQVETGVGTGIFETVAVGFSSTAKLSDAIELEKTKKVASGVIVKVIKTNLDNSDQDLYSTIIGVEKAV